MSNGPDADVPPGDVTEMSTEPGAPGGEVALIEVAEFTVNTAEIDPNLTEVVPTKLVPEMVTKVDPVAGPAVGLTVATTGSAK